MSKPEPEKQIIAQNRKARYEYFIEEVLEAGIVLKGSEVKSLREGNANITDAYADEQDGEVLLLQSYIAEYKGANQFNHQPKRPRKLLLHRREIKKLFGKLKVKGYTLVPLSIYFNEKKIVKVELGLAKGKKQYDKREAEKERDWNRDKARGSLE
ncbi:MAG: smpB [Rickettsiaceae bacterium]|nr:smpB [Rickettsiaceae bacterium]